MPRNVRTILAVTLGLTILAVLGYYWLGGFNYQSSRLRLRMHSDSYRAAAKKVIQQEAPKAHDGVFVRHPVDDQTRKLVETPYIYYVRYRGGDFVYFALHDDVTVGDGLLYSASGAVPPSESAIDWERVSDEWYLIVFNNGVLEAGMLQP